MPEFIGKLLAICGLVALALAVTPLGAFIDAHDPWWITQWKWIQRALMQEPSGSPVTINPILFYLGILFSVVGIALS